MQNDICAVIHPAAFVTAKDQEKIKMLFNKTVIK